MESTSTAVKSNFNVQDFKLFPYSNGKINVIEFLEAASNLVMVIDRLGKVFTPVKYDMEGNIEKIKKNYKYDNDSCLLELMTEEHSIGKTDAVEGILWLNRALLFFELIFQEIITCLQTKNYDADMTTIYNLAYEGSVKKYHNWVTKQLFVVICKMAPNFPQILKALEVEDLSDFEAKLLSFNTTLHTVRSKLDSFFKERNLFGESE